MYDNTCRFLAEQFSDDFANWLLGESVNLTEIKPSELSLDPIRADALILLKSSDSVLHLEFQTLPKQNIPFRMLDYRIRVHRKYPTKTIRQVVIYLKETGSELVHQTSFTMERTLHEFDVIRLWEQPASLFLQYPGLIPFAVLGDSLDLEATLRQSVRLVDQIPDPTVKASLMAASGILAGLRLGDETIYRILRRDIMQESTVFRSIVRDAQQEEKRSIALNLLRDGLSIEVISRGTNLPLEEVRQLLQQQVNESSAH